MAESEEDGRRRLSLAEHLQHSRHMRERWESRDPIVEPNDPIGEQSFSSEVGDEPTRWVLCPRCGHRTASPRCDQCRRDLADAHALWRASQASAADTATLRPRQVAEQALTARLEELLASQAETNQTANPTSASASTEEIAALPRVRLQGMQNGECQV